MQQQMSFELFNDTISVCHRRPDEKENNCWVTFKWISEKLEQLTLIWKIKRAWPLMVNRPSISLLNLEYSYWFHVWWNLSLYVWFFVCFVWFFFLFLFGCFICVLFCLFVIFFFYSFFLVFLYYMPWIGWGDIYVLSIPQPGTNCTSLVKLMLT